MDLAQTIVDNKEYLDICGEHLGEDLNNVKSQCSNLTHDLGTLASDFLNSTQEIWNVTSDVVTIVELLNNCSKESVFKRAKCYTKVFEKVTKLVDHYFARTIQIVNLLIRDAKDVVVDINSCFHHKTIEREMFNEKFQKCIRELSVIN